MSQRVRSSLTTVVVWLVAGALAMAGLVWITIWAVAELRPMLGASAPLVIGLLLLAPLAIVALSQALRAQQPRFDPTLAAYERSSADHASFSHAAASPRPHAVMTSDEPEEGFDIASAVMAFIQRSPLTAVALGAAAGLVLARSPGLLSRLHHLFDDGGPQRG